MLEETREAYAERLLMLLFTLGTKETLIDDAKRAALHSRIVQSASAPSARIGHRLG